MNDDEVRTLDKCPPIGDPPRNCANMMGVRYGTLTVLGYYVSGSAHSRKANAGKGNPLWVVRCDCGAYEFRQARVIRKKVAAGSMTGCCRRCYQTLKTNAADEREGFVHHVTLDD